MKYPSLNSQKVSLGCFFNTTVSIVNNQHILIWASLTYFRFGKLYVAKIYLLQICNQGSSRSKCRSIFYQLQVCSTSLYVVPFSVSFLKPCIRRLGVQLSGLSEKYLKTMYQVQSQGLRDQVAKLLSYSIYYHRIHSLWPLILVCQLQRIKECLANK